MPAATERSFPGAPRQALANAGLTQQAAFYTDGSDNLRIVSVCSQANVTIVLSGRWQRPDGTIGRFVYSHRPNTDRSVRTEDFPLGEGFVLNVTAVASGATVPIGACFVIVQIIGGLGGAITVLGTLVQGYITTTQHRAWPGSPVEGSTDGTPPAFVGQVGNPAVNTDWFTSVPTGARWELLSVHAKLVAGVTGLPRSVSFNVGNGGRFVIVTAPNADQGDTVTYRYTWAQGLAIAGPGSNINVQGPLPIGLQLPAGANFGTFSAGLGGGDQWSEITYVYREWLEVP